MKKPSHAVPFFALAAFILLAPAWPHLSGRENGFVRPWMMYQDVGVGGCKVRMELTDVTGGVRWLTVREANAMLGRKTARVPKLRSWEAFDLARAVTSNLPPGTKLSVTVHEARRSGWELKHDKHRDAAKPETTVAP